MYDEQQTSEIVGWNEIKKSYNVGIEAAAEANLYLQKTLGSCLPPALATIATLKPCDPITFLAHYLYEYREFHPLQSTSSAGLNFKEQENVSMLPNFMKNVKVHDSSHFRANYLSDLKSSVHHEVIHLCKIIGDIFDDSDIE